MNRIRAIHLLAALMASFAAPIVLAGNINSDLLDFRRALPIDTLLPAVPRQWKRAGDLRSLVID